MDGFADGLISGLTANRNNDAAFGSWIWIILVFALIWGNNGGGLFGRGGGTADGYTLASDFSNIERKIDGVNNGLSDGFYAMNTGMLNGFSNLSSTIMTSGYETRSAIATLSTAMQQCCCNIRESIAALKYDMATMDCGIKNAINTAARDIIDSQRDGTAQILSFLTNEKLSSLQARNATLEAQLSQNAQTATLINALRPTAVPAYLTCSPYQSALGINPYANSCGGCCMQQV